MWKCPKMAQISWALVRKYVFKRSQLYKNLKNEGNHNNVLYVVFYDLSDDTSDFSHKAIWNFTFFYNNRIGGGRGIFSLQYSIFLLAIFNIPTFNIPIPTFIHLKYSFYFLCIPIFILNNSVVVIVYLFILIMACFMFLDSLSANRMKITRNICKIRII